MLLRLFEAKGTRNQECDLAVRAGADAVLPPTAWVEQVRRPLQVPQQRYERAVKKNGGKNQNTYEKLLYRVFKSI